MWFTAIVPCSGAITIETYEGSNDDHELDVSTGMCGSLTSVNDGCQDSDNSPDGSNAEATTITGLTPGDLIYIMVDDRGDEGDFSICAYGINLENCVCSDIADAAPTAPIVTDAACDVDDNTIIPGVIDYSPTMCPDDTSMEFSTDGGTTWVPGPGPSYDDTMGISFQIRCLCDEDSTLTSPVTIVTTNPGFCPQPVPTLSQWGLITLMLMFMSYGAVALGRATNLVTSFKKK